MRAYSESTEETLRARDLVKDWLGESLLTAEQYKIIESETAVELRRTNIFLRIVLFLFTLIIVGAGIGLFFVVSRTDNEQAGGIFLLFFAGISYAAAEFAVSQARLYRYGIEEALAVCFVGFLCVGMDLAFFKGSFYSPAAHPAEFLVPAAGAIASLWIWHRFGLPYAFFGAMIFIAGLPPFWTSSVMASHLIVAACYLAGLVTLALVRPRYRLTYLNSGFSIAEALLWLGIYMAINLQLSPWDLMEPRSGFSPAAGDFSKPFYWATWVLTWCLPAAALTRGLRQKDRFVVAAGAITAILTLITNKPYLGWPRHTWDPMLLGALLIGVALFVRRWLAKAPGGIRHGYTAQRLSGKDKRWMSAGITSIGFVAPAVVAPTPPTPAPGVKFGGGDSGGAGASSDF